MLSTPKTDGPKAANFISERAVRLVSNWLLAPFPAIVMVFLQNSPDWWYFAVMGLSLSILAKLSESAPAGLRDYLLSFCFVGHCILLTAAFTGHPWQADSHMLYFAVLAIISTMSNIPALLFAAALVAVHHLALSVLFPSILFPTGTTLENLERTVMHAAIVVLETGVLIVSIFKRSQAEAALVVERRALQEQTEIAQAANAAAQKDHENSEFVVRILQTHLEELADGDMSSQIRTELPDDYAKLQHSYNASVHRLGTTLEDVATVASSIKKSIVEMATSSQELTHRTATQAGTLKQTAAAIETLTSSVGDATKDANATSKSIMDAHEKAQATGAIFKDAVKAMSEIEISSGQISNIVDVIDDIAFQTNLLALNAGVEAARAGDAGMGFAVVATEVRSLAQRVAESATEIKGLIDQSANHVRDGSEFVDKTGSAIGKIVDIMSGISVSMSDIAKNSEDQSNNLNDISTGLTDLDKVTQHNAAMAGSLMQNGDDLSDFVHKLDTLLRQFQLSGRDDAPSRDAPANDAAA